MTFIHFRVEHGYTTGQVFPHHTCTCKHCTCTRYIPYQPVNNMVPFETHDITLTHSILVIKMTKITIITEMLYYNIVFKGDGEIRDGSCHLYLLSKKNQQKKTPKRGMGGRGVAIVISCCCCHCCSPCWCCMYACPLHMCAPTIPSIHLSLCSSSLVHTRSCLWSHVRLCACLCWFPLPGCACLGFVCARSHLFVPTQLCSFELVPTTWSHSFGLHLYPFILIRACLGFDGSLFGLPNLLYVSVSNT